MMAKSKRLNKPAIAHLLRAAAGVTGEVSFVVVGTGAVIAQLKAVPLDLMDTREIDVYAPDAADADDISTLIDGTIGEGSPFDQTFGYFAHGVGERTACLPDDWRSRAALFDIPGLPDVTCLCPDVNDIALSKVCAFRDKDVSWLKAGLTTGIVDIGVMRHRVASISNANAPNVVEIERRLDWLAAFMAAG